MSNRLESLNSKKTPATPSPKVSLKFKPKVVPRKSKEERAKDAPIQVKEENSGRGTSSRGRGSTRGRGRGGRNNYAGTHVVSSGPLASGSVSLGNASGSKLGLTRDKVYNSISSTPEFIQKLKLQDKTKSLSPDAEEDSDEDRDITKIDMTKKYRFGEEESQFLPVRPERDDPDYESKEIQPQESRESTASIEEVSAVKKEPTEDTDNMVEQNSTPMEPALSSINIVEETESDKLIKDHKDILGLLAYKFANLRTDSETPEISDVPDDKFVLFQLPKILPKYQLKTTVKSENQSNGHSTPSETIQGEIGKLNIHKSGKISINIGNDINLSVANGAPTSFLQELVVLNLVDDSIDDDVEMSNEDGIKVKGSLVRLGEVDGKIIATPSLD
ncbi:RNA polymerase III (C) subunit [Scheffersomyces coipomensis]|uniref:RNA polymerase III (C) subunit n=1 Tax=Scheffersomyces coipomensis TaxID=1788519 RepID=UPI00315D49DC